MNQAEKTNWVIDPAHSEIHFKVKHLVISNVTGAFDKFNGTVQTVMILPMLRSISKLMSIA